MFSPNQHVKYSSTYTNHYQLQQQNQQTQHNINNSIQQQQSPINNNNNNINVDQQQQIYPVVQQQYEYNNTDQYYIDPENQQQHQQQEQFINSSSSAPILETIELKAPLILPNTPSNTLRQRPKINPDKINNNYDPDRPTSKRYAQSEFDAVNESTSDTSSYNCNKVLKNCRLLFCSLCNYKRSKQMYKNEDDEKAGNSNSNKFATKYIMGFIAMITITLLIVIYIIFFYSKFNVSVADQKATTEYMALTKNVQIKTTSKHKFRGYHPHEFDARKNIVKSNAYTMENWLKAHKDEDCVSTLEILEIADYPFHVVIRDPHIDDKQVHQEFIQVIYPIYNITDVAYDGSKVRMFYNTTSNEMNTHCQRVGLPLQNVQKQRTNHIVVHYMDTDKVIYHTSMYKHAAACIQHYGEIYRGDWPC